MSAVGLWLALTVPSATPAPAVRGLLVSGADVAAPIIRDGTMLFRIAAVNFTYYQTNQALAKSALGV